MDFGISFLMVVPIWVVVHPRGSLVSNHTIFSTGVIGCTCPSNKKGALCDGCYDVHNLDQQEGGLV
jgi:hypothetical protein